MTDRQLRLLEKGWAGTFRREILPKIVECEDLFAPLYSSNKNSRPSTPTYLVLALLVIKTLHNLTDEEVEERLAFSVDYQYALGTTSYRHQPVNQRTLNRFRTANAYYTSQTGIDLIAQFTDKLAESLKDEYLGKNLKRRMDSIMIDNGCRKLSRLQLAHVIVKNTLNLLCDSEISIPEELHHYIEDFDENNVTYHSKQPASEKLETAFRDACAVRDLIPSDLQDSEEAQLLNRFISEQIIIDDDGSYKAVRDGKELTSTALNNPAEPESTIRRKAGEIHQGFVGNFAESVDMDTNRKIIDSADLQPNIYSDSQFAKDEIKKMAAKGDTSTLTADGAYAGVDNVNLAAENGIELIGTAFIGKETPDLAAEFEISEEEQTVVCPYGEAADRASYCEKTDSWKASFIKEKHCQDCPHHKSGKCPLRNMKNVRSGRISRKMIQRAKIQREAGSEKYVENYRFRNGVEAIPSQLRRNQNIDHLPYRGLLRKKQGYVLAITAINVRRVLKYAQEDAEKALNYCFKLLFQAIFVKMESISQIIWN